jgi:hypothetical protein
MIDATINNIQDSFDCVFGRLCNRFANVTDIVITRRALRDIQPIDLLPMDNNRDDTTTPIEKTKRVVLHLPHVNANALW